MTLKTAQATLKLENSEGSELKQNSKLQPRVKYEVILCNLPNLPYSHVCSQC